MTREDWIRANPLRVWRLASSPKIAQGEGAARMDVSEQTVRMWERGGMGIADTKLDKLEELTQVPAFVEKWGKWKGERGNVESNR